MGSVRRRLEAIEGKIRPRASPGERPPWRSPEQEVERERQFEELYRELGMERRPDDSKTSTQLLEELFAEIQEYRAGIDRKERQR